MGAIGDRVAEGSPHRLMQKVRCVAGKTQIHRVLRHAIGVDTQLIADGTYYVVEAGGRRQTGTVPTGKTRGVRVPVQRGDRTVRLRVTGPPVEVEGRRLVMQLTDVRAGDCRG